MIGEAPLSLANIIAMLKKERLKLYMS